MKIGFISDLHLGFGSEKEIYEDSFKVAENILSELAKNCDIIFIAGDLFDEKDPKNEIILKTIQIFKKIEKKDKKIKFKINNNCFEENVPIIFAIHGNHDRKFKDETSIYKIFNELNFFHYITFGKIIFEEEKICIYAMSNVPEKYAKNFLDEKLNPKAEKDYFNILVLHQNVFPYVYSIREEVSLKITDLPKDFDLIVNGHIHLRDVKKLESFTILILGSPIITQIREEEINEKRGFNIIEIKDNKNFEIIFKEIELPRKYYLIKFELENFDGRTIEEKINEIIKSNNEKPVIKIKLVGKKDLEEKIIKNLLLKFKDRAIIKFESLIESEETKDLNKNIEILRERKSIDEVIFSVLLEKLKEKKFSNSFDIKKLMELFEDGDVDSLVEILTKIQRTLEEIK